MCGIAGLYRLDERVDFGRLRHMSQLLRHRGPDDEGIVLIDPQGGAARTLGGPDTPRDVFRAGLPYSPGQQPPGDSGRFRIGFAHRRLAIIDLSPTGHQPMCDADGQCWITYNGEIYNFVELREELEALGERVSGPSDTAVILAAWRRWGPDCLAHLNGMFALALWDQSRRELFCARDRFGVKPFYYQWDGRGLAFASEPKALVLTQRYRIRPRLAAIRDLVALDWVDHEPETFFAGVAQLPAGHYMIVGERGLSVRRWWTLDPTRRATGGPEEWTREFARRFDDAVRLRLLRSDVEVGSCLSGGLDSSAVVTTAASMLERPIHAFTCAYDEGPRFDERGYVKATVAKSGAVSDVVVPDGSDFWATFDRLADQQDEPTAGPGVYSQWQVMRLAHDHGLKVLLDGQGGDETLAGYWRYLPLRLRDLLGAGDLPGFFRAWPAVANRLGTTTTLALTLEPWLPAGLVAPLRRRFGQGKDRVLSAALRALPEHRLVAPREFPSAVSRQQAFDTLQRLLPSLLRYEDRNSMAFSIETRLPFLDYRLAEFVFSLPDSQRLEDGTTKVILRRALADRIPDTILARQDKMGFETPADIWLRGRFAAETRRRLMTPGLHHEWLDPARMGPELEDYLAGRREIGLQVWRWLSLEAWARRFLATDPRVIERPLEAQTHPGLHKSYTQAASLRAAEYGLAAAGAEQPG